MRIALTVSALVLATALAACEPPDRPAAAGSASASTAAASAPAPDTGGPRTHAFTVDGVQVVAVRDAGPSTLPNPALPLPWSDAAAVAAAQQAAGRPADQVALSVQPLLVRDGERLILIDAGAGGGMGMSSSLLASLRAAGVTPEQVTDVLISHAHGDHVGGLANAQGQLTFPNATVRMTAAEWAYARAGAAQNHAVPLIRAITPRVQTFAPGARISPHVLAVALPGHTPGHSGYQIGEGADALLYFGDAMHSDVVSVRRPDLPNQWDSDSAAAIATRRDLLSRAAAQNLRLYGNHFPFPGVGRVRREGEGFVWVPEGS